MTTIQTSVPDVTITENGLSVPEIADVLSGRLTDLVTALSVNNSTNGLAPSTALSSPQGQIAMSDTEIVAQVYDKLLVLFNQINPDYASGRFQDGIGQIYFMNRIAGAGTVVTATVTGAVGTLIPSGSTAQDTAGYIYSTTSDVTIPASGSINVDFTNQTNGPIPCAVGSLNTIYRAVPGWDAVYNSNSGVVGTDVESRIAFETRRKDSVYRGSRNQDGSVRASLLATDGVLDSYVWSNRTDAVVNKGTTNFPVKAHSIYIAVYGGSDADVAESIFQTYNPGANLNGDTTYTVVDTTYEPPQPQYVMQWQRAIATPVYFRVTIDGDLNPPSDITSQVQTVIQNAFNGLVDGIPKARIGSTISASRFYAPVIAIDSSSVSILSLTVSLDNSTFGASVTMGIDQVPTISASNIVVTLS